MYSLIGNLSKRLSQTHVLRRIKAVRMRYFATPSVSNTVASNRSTRFGKRSFCWMGMIGTAASVAVVYKIGVKYECGLVAKDSTHKFSVVADDANNAKRFAVLESFSVESSVSSSDGRSGTITSLSGDSVRSISTDSDSTSRLKFGYPRFVYSDPLKVLDSKNLEKQVENVKAYIKSTADKMRVKGIDLAQEKVVVYVHGYGPGQESSSKKRTKKVIDEAFDEKQLGTVLTFNLTYNSFDSFWGVRKTVSDEMVPYVLAHVLLELQKEEYGWNQIAVIAHSMGNYALCKCVSLLVNGKYNHFGKDSDAASSNGALYDKFDFSKIQLVSCAAGIDLDKLQVTVDDLKGIKKEHKPKKWTSYYNKSDHVLQGWDAIDSVNSPLKTFMLGRKQCTYLDENDDNKLLIQCVDCTGVERDVSLDKHSYCFENQTCVNDMKQLLKDDKLDPQKRSTKLKKDGNKGHWKFPKIPARPWYKRIWGWLP